ncbi:hypothetical protein Taro_040618 [Colocasia esculenta]|uniref:Uncharacterized protein n=1 Tax=Colocasia esculenta TaxID=4460 RepID=A0A843WME3_COLES|nr:hypothetical protein [Colocasia esculenta]
MVVLAAHSSPSSFQLRWGLHCRKPSPGSLRTRFPSSHARVRLARVVACRSAAGEEGDGSQASRASSVGASDPFAGWSGEESDDGPQQKGKLGGIMGVGLAGIFFAAGISFAAISLGRKTAGIKKHMEPLTIEQEVLLASDEQKEKIDSVENESSSTLTEGGHNHAPDPETGISEEQISHVENHDTASNSRVDSIKLEDSSMIEDNGSSGTDVDAFHKTSTQENLNSSNFLDCPSEPTGSDLVSTGEPAHAGDLPSDDFSINASNSNLASSTSYTSIELSDNLETGDLDGQYSSGSDSTNLNFRNQDEVILSVGSEHSKLSSDSSGSKVDHSSDISMFEGSDTLHTNTTLDSQFVSNDIAEAVVPDSGVHDPELQPLLPNDAHTSPSVVHSINANVPPETNSQSNLNLSETLEVPFETTSPSLVGDKLDVEDFGAPALLPVSPLENGSGTGVQYESDRGESSSEMLPQKSFSSAGIPAPSLVSAASQVSPGKVLVPAVIDQVQEQALAALQVLKRELLRRRWLREGNLRQPRNPAAVATMAMVSEEGLVLAVIHLRWRRRRRWQRKVLHRLQNPTAVATTATVAEEGLAPAMESSYSGDGGDSGSGSGLSVLHLVPNLQIKVPLSFAWRLVVVEADIQAGDICSRREYARWLVSASSILSRNTISKVYPAMYIENVTELAFDDVTPDDPDFPSIQGYTRLFQPDKPVTKAQAAIALATGDAAEVVGEELARIEAETMADAAVAAHTALVAEVEKDLNASFEEELTMERQKIDAVEKLAEEARLELEKLKKERAEENNALIRGRAAVESEMEVLSKLRNEVEEQLQSLVSNKMEIAFERERINKLRKEAEKENEVIVQLQYELEVERKALSMARSWAEEEAKRANEQAKALEEARERWERHGLKIVVDENLRDDEIAGTTWLNAGKQWSLEETIKNGESLLDKLKAMALSIKGQSAAVVEKIIQIITSLVSALKQWVSNASQHASELRGDIIEKASKSRDELRANASEFTSSIADRSSKSIQELQDNASGFCSSIRDGAKRAVEDCREGVEKLTQRFKT